MRILLVVDPGIPVPPQGYGGIERVVALLAKEYQRMGHHVELLASAGSKIEGCTLHVIGNDGFPQLKRVMHKAIFRAWSFIWFNRKKYDLIHNFGRLMYLIPVLPYRTPKIMCYQREISRFNIKMITLLPNRNLIFSGCSQNLVNRANVPGKWYAIHNTIDFNQYIYSHRTENNAPLIFLGRIEKIKGCHTAIKVAKETGSTLIIAGNISTLKDEKEYFESDIRPWINGKDIIYVGEVNDEEKNNLLRNARALLMPIEWNEPFGIVMIEAMACGTPVVAFDRGAVDEVVDHGITGFKVHDLHEMIKAVSNIRMLDRVTCAMHARKRFDIPVIAAQYLQLFSWERES